MSSTVMQATHEATARPKRKRAAINYAESQETQNDEDLSDEGYSSACFESMKTTKKAKTSSRQASKARVKPFPFMNLPFELREMIYKLALTGENGQYITAATKKQRHTIERIYQPKAKDVSMHDDWREPSNGVHDDGLILMNEPWRERPEALADKISPALLAVSRTMHEETINILYGQKFCFETTRAMYDFLVTIGTKNQARLLYLTLLDYKRGERSVECYYNYPAFTALGGAINLRSFYIAADIRFYGGGNHGKRLAGQLYRNAFRFMERYGEANGSRDAAVKIIRFHVENFKTYAYNKPITVEEVAQTFQKELRSLLYQPKF